MLQDLANTIWLLLSRTDNTAVAQWDKDSSEDRTQSTLDQGLVTMILISKSMLLGPKSARRREECTTMESLLGLAPTTLVINPSTAEPKWAQAKEDK